MTKTRQKQLKRKMNSIKGITTQNSVKNASKQVANFELWEFHSAFTVFEIDDKKTLALGVNADLGDGQLQTFTAELKLSFSDSFDFANKVLSNTAHTVNLPVINFGDCDRMVIFINKNLPSFTKDRKGVITLLNSQLNKYGLSTKDYGIR